jgi:hypothetical protein
MAAGVFVHLPDFGTVSGSILILGTPACRLLPLRFVRVRGIVAKMPKIHDDTFNSLLDRIGILREELISIERSLERMKAAGIQKGDGSLKRGMDRASNPF